MWFADDTAVIVHGGRTRHRVERAFGFDFSHRRHEFSMARAFALASTRIRAVTLTRLP